MGVWALIFFSIFQLGYFHRWSVINFPRFWTWLPFFIAALLIIVLACKLALEKTAIFYNGSPLHKLFLFTIGLFFIGVISCLINDVSPIMGIFGLRYVLLMIIMAILLYNFKNLNLDIESFMRFIVWISLLQIPFTILQRTLFSVFKIAFVGDAYDLISGTLSSYTELSFIQLFSFSIIFIYWLRTGKSILGKFVLPLVICVSIPILLSNGRAAILFMIILVIALIIRYGKELVIKRPHFSGYIIVIITIISIGVVFVFWGFQAHDYNRDLKTQYSYNFMKEYTYKPSLSLYDYQEFGEDPRMGRIAAILTAFDLIKKGTRRFLFGLGPGNTQRSLVFGNKGEYYQNYGSLSGLSRNQISLIISELGIIGVFLHFLLLYWIWKGIRIYKNKNSLKYLFTEDVFFFLLIIIILHCIYADIFTNYVGILVFSYFIATLQEQYFSESYD